MFVKRGGPTRIVLFLVDFLKLCASIGSLGKTAHD
jgi:hypothetical protein